MTETKSPKSSHLQAIAEVVNAEAVAKQVAEHVVAVVDTFLQPWRKPNTSGDPSARECLMAFNDLLPFDQRKIESHIQPIADAVCYDIASRGVPHSFVAPTWNRPGSTMLAEHIASAGVDGAVIRVVVFEEPNHLPTLAVLWSPRFAAE